MSSAFCLGQHVIDEQHKRLEKLAFDIDQLLAQHADPACIKQQCLRYAATLETHFSDEEIRLKFLGLPPEIIQVHAYEHRCIAGEISSLRNDLDHRENAILFKERIHGLIDEHNLKFDRPLINFFRDL